MAQSRRVDEMNRLEVTPEEFEQAVRFIKTGGLRIATVTELLKAVELGVINKTEARKLLGLGPGRGGTRATPRRAGRFTAGK